MIVVLDASVAAMWFVPEAGSEAAARWLDSGYELVAPDWLRIEVASALVKALRRGTIDRVDAEGAMARLVAPALRLVPALDRLTAAFAIALEHGGSLYDGIYVALARSLDAPLLTHDDTMARVATAAGVAVRRVGEAPR